MSLLGVLSSRSFGKAKPIESSRRDAPLKARRQAPRADRSTAASQSPVVGEMGSGLENCVLRAQASPSVRLPGLARLCPAHLYPKTFRALNVSPYEQLVCDAANGAWDSEYWAPQRAFFNQTGAAGPFSEDTWGRYRIRLFVATLPVPTIMSTGAAPPPSWLGMPRASHRVVTSIKMMISVIEAAVASDALGAFRQTYSYPQHVIQRNLFADPDYFEPSLRDPIVSGDTIPARSGISIISTIREYWLEDRTVVVELEPTVPGRRATNIYWRILFPTLNAPSFYDGDENFILLGANSLPGVTARGGIIDWAWFEDISTTSGARKTCPAVPFSLASLNCGGPASPPGVDWGWQSTGGPGSPAFWLGATWLLFLLGHESAHTAVQQQGLLTGHGGSAMTCAGPPPGFAEFPEPAGYSFSSLREFPISPFNPPTASVGALNPDNLASNALVAPFNSTHWLVEHIAACITTVATGLLWDDPLRWSRFMFYRRCCVNPPTCGTQCNITGPVSGRVANIFFGAGSCLGCP